MRAQAPPLSAIQALSPNHVWAVGSGRIVSSHDGGTTWQVEFSGPEQLIAVDAIDDNHAWAVGIDMLLGTTDGGHTWNRLGESKHPLTSVHFVSDTSGFGVESACALEITHDGGRTWDLSPTAPLGVASTCFTGALDGWIGALGQVWRTADGGITWHAVLDTTNQAIQEDRVTLQCAYPTGVAVEAEALLGAAGSRPHAAWISAGDDHFTQVWAAGMWPAPDTLPSGPGSYPGPFSIVTQQYTVWFGNTPAGIPKGVDIGESAKGLYTHESQVACSGSAASAAFIFPSKGWVICLSSAGTDATVIVTTDAGHTWSVQYKTPS